MNRPRKGTRVIVTRDHEALGRVGKRGIVVESNKLLVVMLDQDRRARRTTLFYAGELRALSAPELIAELA